MALAITAAITLAFGVVLGVGGVWLSSYGGSAYYLIAGISLSAIGLSLWSRRAEALWFYGALLGATLAWAIIEVGLDWWPLAARGGVLVLLGVWLLTPFVTRRLKWGNKEAVGRIRLIAVAPLAVSLVASVAVAAVAILVVDLHDTEGALPGQVNEYVAGAIPDGDWPAYGRTIAGNRWSPLASITTANVGDLEVAWTYHTGEIPEAGGPATFEVTPLKIGDTVYLCTPRQVAIALDAATGTERWRFDPAVDEAVLAERQTCRGVSYFASDAPNSEGLCAARIYLPTADARLIALDAATGAPCLDFGTGGTVDLWQSMPNQGEGKYFLSSPPLVAAGRVIVGGSVADTTGPLPSGVIRAYDAVTGRLMWNFDTGNPDTITPRRPDQTYAANSPNSWSIMSADENLGLVFAPIGNAPPDQYGAERPEVVDRLSSSVVALDIDTGRLMWSYQTVHHDLWDMDVPAQPVLIDLTIGNAHIPALVQATKQGDVYVLDRRTGQPLVPVTEVDAPQEGAVDGEILALTQRESALTFAPANLTEESMWGVTMFDQLACRIWFQSLAYDGRYTPPSVQGTLQHPGNFGVFNWGGVAIDPLRQVMIGTPSYLAFRVRMIPRPEPAPAETPPAPETPAPAAQVAVAPAAPAAAPAPAVVAQATPAAAPATPAVVIPPGGVAGAITNPLANAPADAPPTRRVTPPAAATPVAQAPATPAPVAAAAVAAPAAAEADTPAATPVDLGPPFTADIDPFVSILGVPCQAPPWGYVAGVNLSTGRLAWQHVSGGVQDRAPIPLPFEMGVPTLGGPLATAGGVVFISGTLDYFIRAYDVTTGEELWRDRLPAGGQATPMTYATDDGRQFLIVVAGGHGELGTAPGDSVIAYALPASTSATPVAQPVAAPTPAAEPAPAPVVEPAPAPVEPTPAPAAEPTPAPAAEPAAPAGAAAPTPAADAPAPATPGAAVAEPAPAAAAPAPAP